MATLSRAIVRMALIAGSTVGTAGAMLAAGASSHARQAAKPAVEAAWREAGVKSAVGVVAAGVGYAAWRLFRRRTVLRRKIDPLTTSVEGLVPGSQLLEGATHPKCQVAVAIKIKDDLMLVGSGFRLEDYLVMPAHNGHSAYDLYMVKGPKEYKVDLDTGLSLAADVVAFPIPDKVWCDLGVAQAKLTPIPSMGMTVTVSSSCSDKYSVGTCRVTQPLGRVVYTASTEPGFSGSVYSSGQAVVGMHCHGGAMAGGYEALYLWCRLKAHLKQTPESSAEFFMQNVEKYDYEELWDDQVVMRTEEGHYHLTTKDIVKQLKQLKGSKNWADQMEMEELKQELSGRDDYVPECLATAGFSGESRGPKVAAQRPQVPLVAPQAGSSLVANVQRQPISQQASVQSQVSISEELLIQKVYDAVKQLDQERWLARQKLLKKQQKGTGSQTQVQKPSTTASVSN